MVVLVFRCGCYWFTNNNTKPTNNNTQKNKHTFVCCIVFLGVAGKSCCFCVPLLVCVCCFNVVVYCLPTTQSQKKTTNTRSKQTNTKIEQHRQQKHHMLLFAFNLPSFCCLFTLVCFSCLCFLFATIWLHLPNCFCCRSFVCGLGLKLFSWFAVVLLFKCVVSFPLCIERVVVVVVLFRCGCFGCTNNNTKPTNNKKQRKPTQTFVCFVFCGHCWYLLLWA